MAIGIIWIGNTLYAELDEQDILKQIGVVCPPPAEKDDSKYLQTYAITSTGEPLGICEYAARIASTGESTNVISLIDF